MIVYKIVATEEWTEAAAAGVFKGAPSIAPTASSIFPPPNKPPRQRPNGSPTGTI